jgi:hypothetical protein
MHHWHFWDWAAYSTLFIGAVIIAADAGIKMAPNLKDHFSAITSSPYWGCAPLVLILLSTCIFITREVIFPANIQKPPASQLMKWAETYQPISVVGKPFINELVRLDGYSYQNCDFTHVTFLYNGTTPIQFVNNRIDGSFVFRTDNPAVLGTVYWLKAFVGLPDTMKLDIPPERLQEFKHIN